MKRRGRKKQNLSIHQLDETTKKSIADAIQKERQSLQETENNNKQRAKSTSVATAMSTMTGVPQTTTGPGVEPEGQLDPTIIWAILGSAIGFVSIGDRNISLWNVTKVRNSKNKCYHRFQHYQIDIIGWFNSLNSHLYRKYANSKVEKQGTLYCPLCAPCKCKCKNFFCK